jgi:Glycosyltransferase family 87
MTGARSEAEKVAAAESVRPSGDRWRSLAFLTMLALLFSSLACYALPEKIISVDFICYFSAARILAAGQSPYDLASQTEVQHALGWERATSGFGVYDCLPYYYPPWFALACVPLLPLGYPAAKVVFFFLNIEMALLSGYLLRDRVRGVPRRLPVVFISLFIFTIVSVLLGQTALLILFLVVAAWKLLDGGRDRAAGVVLACLTIKPQLTAVLLLGVLLWAIRQRRWGVIGAFFVTSALLAGICTAIVPSWPLQMLNAPRQTSPPTELYPWIGNTWFLVLRAAGAQGWGLWLLYLALAVPFLVAVVRAALDRTRALADVVGLGILAAFFVAPYARHYDFPVLIVPILILLGGRLSRVVGGTLLMAVLLLPYLEFILLQRLQPTLHPGVHFLHESAFFWVPMLLASAWVLSGRKGRTTFSTLVPSR